MPTPNLVVCRVSVSQRRIPTPCFGLRTELLTTENGAGKRRGLRLVRPELFGCSFLQGLKFSRHRPTAELGLGGALIAWESQVPGLGGPCYLLESFSCIGKQKLIQT